MRKPKWLKLPEIKDKRRAVSRIQSLIIVLLAASAIILAGGRAGFSLGGSLPAGTINRESGTSGQAYFAAAQPMCVVVTPETGAHNAMMYSSRELEDANGLYGAALAEALGSAGEPQEVTAEEWREALSGSGVYFDYYTDCQLSSFAIWMGSDMDSSARLHSARRLCLSVADGEVVLYYTRERHNEFYRCSTELSYSELYERIGDSEPDGAQFAFELDGELPLVDQYAVIASGELEVRTIEGVNSLDQSLAEEMMSAFGMSANLANNYPNADGTDVFLEGSATLRLGSDGNLRFTRREVEAVESISPSDAVQITSGILEATVGFSSGIADVRLTEIYLDGETGEYTLKYDYAVDGLPVNLQGRESAATFTIVGDTVTSADILFRSYSYTGGTEHPLPARLAAALVQSEGGGEPRLVYIDSYGSARANWIVL